VQPGYGDGSPHDPLPDYLQPGFAPRGAQEPPPKNRLPWIVGAVAVVLIVVAVAAVLMV
jgi:hypothetical protein